MSSEKSSTCQTAQVLVYQVMTARRPQSVRKRACLCEYSPNAVKSAVDTYLEGFVVQDGRDGSMDRLCASKLDWLDCDPKAVIPGLQQHHT